MRASSSLQVFSTLAAVAAIAYGVNGARHLLQATPDISALPEQCISGGLSLQSSCGGEITAAQNFFGLNSTDTSAAGNISNSQIATYLATAQPPSSQCCSAACNFNAQLCSCDPGVLNLVASFTGNNVTVYSNIAQAFAGACNFTAYINATCPLGDLKAIPKPFGAPCPAV